MNRFVRAAEALGVPKPKNLRKKLEVVMAVVMAATSLVWGSGFANAATLTTASVALSDPRPGQTSVNYTFTGSSVTSTTIRCVRVVVSATTASTQAPAGFSGAAATVTAASSTLVNSSATGWTLAKSDGTSSTGQNNIFQYTNTTGITPGTLSGATFILGAVTNPTTPDVSYYYRLATFGNVDCSTTPVDNATVQFINTNGSTLSLTVDATLSFTVNAVASGQACNGTTTTAASSATTIPFGTVNASTNAVVCQDLTAASNSTNGYSIYSRYTAAPTNALNQTIANHSASNTTPAPFSAAGVEAYGYSTNDASLGTGTANRFTSPAQNWAALTTTNAEVAYEAAGVTSTTYRIGHQAGVALTTDPGTYTTTVIYTCTPVY